MKLPRSPKAIAITVVALVVIIGGLAFALTRGGDESPNADETTPTPSNDNALSWPLTGLSAKSEKDLRRSVVTVKVDNHPDARPQFGLDKADVIVEEKVEGDMSRLMVLFHSQNADRVGPVRSLRDTDVNWLQPVGGLLAYSGGIDPVKARLAPAGIVDVGADSHGPRWYPTRKDRTPGHNMSTNTNLLREFEVKDPKAPPALFTYRTKNTSFDAAGAAPVSRVDGRFSGQPYALVFAWSWNPEKKSFVRETDNKPHEIEGDGQIAMPNVILQFTKYSRTPYKDRANSPVDQAEVTGSGEAWVLSGGKLAKGTWARPSNTQVTTFKDQNGAPMQLAPGQTWLMLAPTGMGVNVQ